MIRQRANEPPWCAKTDHDNFAIQRHASSVREVGNRYHGRGMVGVYLHRADDGPTWLAVVTAHGASCTVDLDVREAVQLRDHIDALLEQAGREDLNRSERPNPPR
jgi:hypothetical protein